MRADQDIAPQDANETDPLNDPDYVRWTTSYDEDTRQQIDRDHAGCTIDNPVGMCGSCEGAYRMAKKLGAEDYGMGIQLERGMAVWLAFHPELPRITYGAVEGYAHGYSKAMLRSILSGGDFPFTEVE